MEIQKKTNGFISILAESVNWYLKLHSGPSKPNYREVHYGANSNDHWYRNNLSFFSEYRVVGEAMLSGRQCWEFQASAPLIQYSTVVLLLENLWKFITMQTDYVPLFEVTRLSGR